MQRIVVGYDGSDGAQAALEWAADEAGRRHAVLHVVSAWLDAPIVGFPDAITLAGVGDEIERDTREMVGTAVTKVTAGSNVETVVDTVRDTATHALLQVSRGATMLVVGSRGLGGFRGLLLGSVSQQCAQHAECPVVIVPPSVHSLERP